MEPALLGCSVDQDSSVRSTNCCPGRSTCQPADTASRIRRATSAGEIGFPRSPHGPSRRTLREADVEYRPIAIDGGNGDPYSGPAIFLILCQSVRESPAVLDPIHDDQA